MATNSSNPSTARQAIKQYLQNNSGWHEITPIVNATGYSRTHILSTGTEMAESGEISRRKNTGKPVVAYLFNGTAEVPGSDANRYIRLIKKYSSGSVENLQGMSLEELQNKLRELADGTTVFEFKVEFRHP